MEVVMKNEEHDRNKRQKVVDEPIGNETKMTTGLLLELIKSNADPEKLRNFTASLANQKLSVSASNNDRDYSHLHDQTCGLSEAIGTVMESIIERETNRQSVALLSNKKVPSEVSEQGIVEEETFIEKKNRKRAYRRATPNESFECDVCLKSFKTRHLLEQHIKIHIEDEKLRCPFKCGECGKRFMTKQKLKLHQGTHLDADNEAKRPFMCEICGSRFTQAAALKEHMEIHLPADEKSTTCEICGKIYSTTRNLLVHKRSHLDSEEEIKPYECKICGMRFTQTAGLWSHKKIHLPANHPRKMKAASKRFVCDICGHVLMSKAGLDNHMISHMEDEDSKRPHKCDVCGRGFSKTSSLHAHSLIHLPDDDPNKKTSECNMCRKKFSRSELDEHKRTEHNGDSKTPFKCEICGKEYGRRQYLERHELEVHLPDDDPRKNVKCEICGKLMSKYRISDHIKKHSDKNDPNARPFNCDECGRSFKKEQDLKIHTRIHNGDFPFKCEICNTGFNAEYQLKTHTEKYCKKISCTLCPKRFKEESELEKHLKKHRDGKVLPDGTSTASAAKPIRTCTVCGQKYKNAEGLRIHQLRHLEGEENQRPYPCDLCDKRFRKPSEVGYHKKLYHPVHHERT